jgi:hypothetical protein
MFERTEIAVASAMRQSGGKDRDSAVQLKPSGLQQTGSDDEFQFPPKTVMNTTRVQDETPQDNLQSPVADALPQTLEDDLDFSDVQLRPRSKEYREIVCEGGCE